MASDVLSSQVIWYSSKMARWSGLPESHSDNSLTSSDVLSPEKYLLIRIS
jgi:hypothetical protein